MDVRVHVVESLVELDRPRLAFRYAMCGTGDQMTKGPDGVGVAPRGCGHPMCPRCGRRSAARHVRRVQGWIGYAEHGDLFNVCFTQRAVVGEPVKGARSRLYRKVRAFMRWATQQGLIAGMTVHHAGVSGHPKTLGAWHYHVHGLLEFPAGRFATEAAEYKRGRIRVSGELATKWQEISERFDDPAAPLFNHRLLEAGPAVEGLREDAGDPDFWTESRDATARVIQYPMRDLAQGITAWRIGGDAGAMRERVMELVRDGRGWKMRRAWGRWRKRCPEELAASEQDADEGPETEAAATPASSKPLGTMRTVFLACRRGDAWAREAMAGLEASVRNDTRFARRLVAWCRAACLQRAGP